MQNLAELPSSFVGVVVDLTTKPFLFLALISTSRTHYNQLLTLLCNIYVNSDCKAKKTKMLIASNKSFSPIIIASNNGTIFNM